MKCFTITTIGLFVGLLTLSGCGQSSAAKTDIHPGSTAMDAAGLLLAEEPEGAMGVIELRQQAKDKDDVVLVGRIGGASQPWVEGRAAFAVVDASIELCEEGEGVCECCNDKVCDATALVKVVDAHGHLVMADARTLLNVKENEVVVVSGLAKRDEAGNLTILASGVYVRR